MKQLSPSFSRNGFRHEQMERTGLIALYARSKKGQPVHYEVIRIRELPERKFPGVTIPAQESYPGAESWGTLGWTFTDYPEASAKYRSLLDSLP